MKLSSDLKTFSKRINYSFKDPELLIRAITHSSFSSATRPDNQRLEFLGDRVLGLVIAQALLEGDPLAAEGTLAPRFNAMVRKEACADIASEIRLGDVLKLGNSEMISGGRKKQAILGDSMEALIAAVYLDSGFETVRTFIYNLWKDKIAEVDEDARDSKTALQEFVQGLGHNPPKYSVIEKSGPDHAPKFKVCVSISTGEEEHATASSKRKAEQAAAKELLDRIRIGK
jgi:ribonuclease-3